MKSLAAHLKRVTTLATKEQQTKRAVRQFAGRTGLVYFGEINMHENGDRLVHGATLAAATKDSHYCFGSHDGYDVAVVLRSSEIHFPGERSTRHNWVVMQFDLHTPTELPHIIVGRRGQAGLLYASVLSIHRDLQEYIFDTVAAHHEHFQSKFVTYAAPAEALLVEQVVSAELTNAIVGHFKHMIVEIEGDSLYLFADDSRPTAQFLNKMLHYGLVLARHIDNHLN